MMAIGDQAGTEAVKLLNEVTLPKLVSAIESITEKLDLKLDENLAQAVNDAHELLDRLDGLTITLHVPGRK